MDLLWVRCTLEHYDTTSVKNFSGSLFVDTSDNSFKIISAGGVEHKFYANEFNRLGKPPSRTTAKLFALEFNVSKQLPAKHHRRKRKLVFRVAEFSQKMRDVYDELAKIFPKGASPDREVPPKVTSPVGMLRSHPESIKRSRPDIVGRPPSLTTEKPQQSESKKPGGIPISKPRSRTSQKSQQSNHIDSRVKINCSGSATLLANRTEIVQNDVIEEPSTSTTLAKNGAGEISKPVHQKTLKYDAWESSKNSATKEQVLSPKETAKKTNNSELGTQGSVIALMEKKSLESCAIKVTAPFTPRPHTVAFKTKRSNYNDSSSSSLARKIAYDFSHDQDKDDDFVQGFSGLGSTSFYGTPKTPLMTPKTPSISRSGPPRRPGDIISPRPRLLADSVSSSRCLLSPAPSNKGSLNSSQHISRDALTPSRKRKEVDASESSPSLTMSMPPSTSEPSPYSYRGLENLTNSCYMNATLQALASVFPFYYRMQMIHQRHEEGYECSEFVKRFNDVLQNLVSPDRISDNKYGSATKISVLEALRTAAGKELGSDPDFGSNVQQDAHEFLAKTLEILEKEALRRKKFSHSTVDDDATSVAGCSKSRSLNRNPAGVFQHKIRDRYGCERCARASEMTNDAIDLTVTVRAGESIQKMIEHALAREEIEYKCDTCGPGSGFISRAFATLPESLIIVVKRYRFGEAGGSKVDERIGVSRELFLKDLYVDSEVKKQEGKARQSLSNSVFPFTGTKPNCHAEAPDLALSKDSAAIGMKDESSSSRKEDVTTVGKLLSAVQQEESDDCLIIETVRSPVRAEKSIVLPHSPATFNKTVGGVSELSLQSQPRSALSPLKMNRHRLSQVGKLEDPIASTRVLNVGETAMDVVVTSASPGVHPEKENVAFVTSSDIPMDVGIGFVKQSGGYLKESSPDAEKGSHPERRAASSEGQNAVNPATASSSEQQLTRNLSTPGISDKEDVPKKRSRVEDIEENEELFGHSKPNTTTENESYARLITEPLRPHSRPSSSRAVESPLQSPEQISVLGEYEERITLVFRPVTEDCQKYWCSQLGIKYTGSPELRKRTFGREIEFSLRDVPLSCEVRGDGNCLFRTLCWWLTGGNEKDHFKLREKLVAFMSQYRSKFASLLPSQQDMETHLQKMSEDGEWGTQVELAAAACWLGVNIYTFLEGKWLKYRPLFRWSMDGSPPITLHRDECTDDRGAIFICNASGCHFQPAVSVERSSSRRNLRPRKDFREVVKESTTPPRTPEPPYVFNSADGPVYSLAAVICHHGDSLLSGHYSTFALDATRREWLDCNDNTITKISEVEVIDNSSSVGYIFIYNRVEDPHKRL
ncbi:hypothetical protein V3C99_002196 [Haemonchus contortus]